MKMYEKKNFPRTANDLNKMYKDGKLSFDNTVQRSVVWDNKKKSLLINSMIIDFPIPPMYCNCIFENTKNKVYDFVDGKQRTLGSIIPFLNDEFKLTDIPLINLDEDAETDEDAEPEKLLDINGLTYSELPEDLRDKVRNYSLTIFYYENMPQEDVEEMMYRLNNGKIFSAIELIRIKAKSLDIIKEIGSHELFTSTLTASALNKYTNEDLVIKSWAILNTENPSFETKEIRPLVENVDITDEQAGQLTQAYTRILDTYKLIKAVEDKEHNKIAKRVITRTHLLSLVPVALQSITDNINVEAFVEFVESFFNGKKSATNSETYNSAAGSGSAKAESVKRRLTAITEAYKTFFKPEVKVDTDGKKGNKKAKVTPIRDFDDILPPKIDDDEWVESFIPNSITDAYNCTMR